MDYRRGGAAGNKLKITLGLPVYVYVPVESLQIKSEEDWG
jgi:hypothetical protein